jgi:hypothetical protein
VPKAIDGGRASGEEVDDRSGVRFTPRRRRSGPAQLTRSASATGPGGPQGRADHHHRERWATVVVRPALGGLHPRRLPPQPRRPPDHVLRRLSPLATINPALVPAWVRRELEHDLTPRPLVVRIRHVRSYAEIPEQRLVPPSDDHPERRFTSSSGRVVADLRHRATPQLHGCQFHTSAILQLTGSAGRRSPLQMVKRASG